MVFSSLEFFVFFFFYFLLHYLLNPNLRIILIIFGSLFFYAYWNPIYVLIPIFLALIAWVTGNWVHNEKLYNYRRLKFFISIIILLLPLIFFKYSEFIILEIINSKKTKLNWLPSSLPLGISFITFTVLDY